METVTVTHGQVRKELRQCSQILQDYGLNVSSRWLLDLLAGIVTDTTSTDPSSSSSMILSTAPLFSNVRTTASYLRQYGTSYSRYLPYWNIQNPPYTNPTSTNHPPLLLHPSSTSTSTSIMMNDDEEEEEERHPLDELYVLDNDIYRIGKQYFDNKEYSRTVHWFDNIYKPKYTMDNNQGIINTFPPSSSTFPSSSWFRRRPILLNTVLHTLSSSSSASVLRYTLHYPTRAYFLRCYALYLDGESKKEAERLQGTVNNPSLAANVNATNENILVRTGTKLPVNQYLMSLYNDLSSVATHFATYVRSIDLSSSSSSSTDPPGTTDPTIARSSDFPLPSSTSSSVSFSTNIHYLSTAILPYLDPFCTYLFAIVLRDLERKDEAKLAFLYALQKFPCNWSAWYDFTKLVDSKYEIDTMVQQYLSLLPPSSSTPTSSVLPHWIYALYQAYGYIEVHANTSALRLLQPLSGTFPHSLWLKALVARALYNIRRFEPAHALFRAIRYQDPYRMDDMDIYSNILYVKGDTPGLAALAQDVHGIGRYTYTPPCCCVIGNYFSARREHERAIIYFRRALRLDRQYTAAWTLMGHEYLELKNTTAAIECYRRAVDTNPRDYRAWYGLGQTYELLHMFLYAAYYYRRTTALRPTDGRMWFALGSCYEQLERRADAIACYERASNTDHDRDGAAAIKLAKLYRSGGNATEAAKWYASYLEERELILVPGSAVPGNGSKDGKTKNNEGITNTSNATGTTSNNNNNNHPDVLEALLYLAKLAKDQKRWNDAEIYVQKILTLPSSTEIREARILLSEIRTGRTLDQQQQRITESQTTEYISHVSVHTKPIPSSISAHSSGSESNHIPVTTTLLSSSSTTTSIPSSSSFTSAFPRNSTASGAYPTPKNTTVTNPSSVLPVGFGGPPSPLSSLPLHSPIAIPTGSSGGTPFTRTNHTTPSNNGEYEEDDDMAVE